MKTYYKRPAKEVRIVRPDADAQEWEFWVLVPTRIGGGKRLGTRRIKSDSNGREYMNLAEMIADDLNAAGHGDLAGDFALGEIKVRTVNGLDLVASGRWPAFCAMRKLDPKDVKAMQQAYGLTPVEAKKLEIE